MINRLIGPAIAIAAVLACAIFALAVIGFVMALVGGKL
jgi:hypothetical protein